jgi:hypothetical protein
MLVLMVSGAEDSKELYFYIIAQNAEIVSGQLKIREKLRQKNQCFKISLATGQKSVHLL